MRKPYEKESVEELATICDQCSNNTICKFMENCQAYTKIVNEMNQNNKTTLNIKIECSRMIILGKCKNLTEID